MKTTKINGRWYTLVIDTYIKDNRIYTQKVYRYNAALDFSDRNTMKINPTETAPSFKVR